MKKVFLGFFAALAWVASAHSDKGRFSSRELANLDEAINRVENDVLGFEQRTTALKREKLLFDQTIDSVFSSSLINLAGAFFRQQGRIGALKLRITNLLSTLGNREAALASASAVANRNQNNVNPLWNKLDAAVDTNVAQTAKLAELRTTLEQSEEKLQDTLDRLENSTLDDLDDLGSASRQFTEKLNTRRCFSDTVDVAIDQDTATGTADLQLPSGTFGTNTPTVLCGVQSIVKRVELDDKSHQPHRRYGYHDSRDERQSSAMIVDCISTNDTVTANVLDQSRGKGNAVGAVVVQVQACSFAALAGF